MALANESTEVTAWVWSDLDRWEPPHPVARALIRGQLPWPAPGEPLPQARSPELAEVLAVANRRWGNPVESELEQWLAGAAVVVAGQQPGLWGGPLLSLVKVCAVAAEVARFKALGKPAVGFFWLETRDDDLPEMGWGRVVVGGEVHEVKESWLSGQRCAFAADLSPRSGEVLTALADQLPAAGQPALNLALHCFAAGQPLGEACARFLASVVRGLGVVLVDASLPALAQAAAPAALRVLHRLPAAWQALHQRAQELHALHLPPPLRLAPPQLPLFHLDGAVRRRLAVARLQEVVERLAQEPHLFSPNVWLRPLFQDAVLGTSLAILGSAELAYHWQSQDLWHVAGVTRPQWKLRPHVTVVGPGERRWAHQLGLAPEEVLFPRLPRRLLEGQALQRRWTRWQERHLREFCALAQGLGHQLPNLKGDLAATEQRLRATLGWLGGRLQHRLEERSQVSIHRFVRLRHALRPQGQAQERALSVLAPLLSLGLEFPANLVKALGELPDPPTGMALLYWRAGGRW
ncbi:MAG: bacillithiol biosynthesis BshC [Thermoanaerobaculum sp.]|nr:bacillithiol biosynthesis BshC [Thermoanaerobaculum sp.]MDW7967932.1 bacillithiol biosynthesis BshC [Thermoanaerobaculum sp.]